MYCIRFVVSVFIFLFSLLFGLPGMAETGFSEHKTVILDPSRSSQLLGTRLSYLEDPESQLTIEALLDRSSSQWVSSEVEAPNFGYSSSTYWYRVEFRNPLDQPLTRFLVIDYPLLDDVELFQFVGNSLIKHYQTGDLFPFSQRPVNHRDFIFPVRFDTGDSTIYLRVKSSGAVQLPLAIWEPQTFVLEDQAELARKSAFYGVLLVMVLFNLFLFISLREAPYLHYVLFVFSFLLTQIAMHGVTFQYFWPSSPKIQELAVLLGVAGCVVFASLFSRSFLSLSHHAPRMDIYFKTTAAIGLINMIMAFFMPYRIVTTMAVFMVVVVSVGCIFIGPYLWLKGQKIARFFAIAWMCMVIATTVLALNKFGVIPYNFFTENGLQFGSAMEAVLLSFALADRLNRERKERWRAQQRVMAEVRQRHHIEETMIYDATHNPLTGLPNRAYLENRFHELIKHAAFDSSEMSIILVHFNRFHEINKTLGHLRADQLLKIVSLKLNNKAQKIKGLIEIEQDESQLFGVAVVEGVSVAMLIDRHKNGDVYLSAKSLISALSTPIEYEGMTIDVGASAGIANYPEHGRDINSLLSHAMIAIDVGISNNKSVTAYSDEINPYNARRLTLMGDLRKAINEDQLDLYYQPQVCFKENRVTCIEALIRWDHPQHGFIPPDEFIPISERTGNIKYVTEWVLDRAIGKISQLNQMGFNLSVAVNISAVNLKEKRFPSLVKLLLTKYGVNPRSLVLEVTETAMMEDPDNALMTLTLLNRIGVRLSIDDFGTGHSSLSYIKKLPVHEIKIDRSFVSEMEQVKDDSIIVKTTINMCHDLGYRVVAEGVETTKTCSQLEQMGCDYVQGYHIARPLHSDDLVIWLRESPWNQCQGDGRVTGVIR